jgi:predicted aldo/keto reductase-like oxidoreductase
MLYRPIGSTGVEASVLGYGCMRLPVIDGRSECVDKPKATELLHYAIDHGVNYVDTAYFYHAEHFGEAGESEPFVGEALEGGWRDRVTLATKMPLWFIKSPDDLDRYLEEQLVRLRTDHIDFYLLHGLNGETWDRMRDLGVREFLDKARADGRIRFPAFSFHGSAVDFPRIVDEYGWAFGQIQYNYMDVDYQAGHAGLRYAADRGLGVVVMEPLKGGRLAKDLPPEMAAIFEKANVRHTPAEWALRFVWNEPGVSLALSGMNDMDQLVENLQIADCGVAESLTEQELAVISRAREAMSARIKADCTACRYCQPCPSGVDIPGVLAALNAASVWDEPNAWLTGYARVGGKASRCSQCFQCERMCPQDLPIVDLMREALRTFGE